MTPANEPAAPGITTLGKFEDTDQSDSCSIAMKVSRETGEAIRKVQMDGGTLELSFGRADTPELGDNDSWETAGAIADESQDVLMRLVTEGINLEPSPGTLVRSAIDESELEVRQRENTRLLGAIMRGRHAWHLVRNLRVSFADADPQRSAGDIAREVRVYLAHRERKLVGCDSLTQAEIRLGIRDRSGTLNMEWL
jgi:hypothetical protein